MSRMFLYERVDLIAKSYAGSRTKLAKQVDIQQRTLDGYFSQQRQDNLWALLPAILKEYPFISRDWLYFGEGEMLKEGTVNQGAVLALPPIDREKELLLKLEREADRLAEKDRMIAALKAEISRLKNSMKRTEKEIDSQMSTPISGVLAARGEGLKTP